jgi:RNA polymerase sigma-70 factor (ECF subfamily)
MVVTVAMVLQAVRRTNEPAGSIDGAAILRLAKTGDLDAFERLVRLHERRVFALAWRVTGDTEDAKDATQEAFIRLHHHLGRIDSAGSLSAWLCTTAVNVCRDIARRRQRSRTVSMDEFAAAAPDPSPGPEALLADRELEDRLMNGLRSLPHKERSALLLREMEGLSTAEVARILGSSEVTVRSQISNARLKLRRFFGREAKR